MSGFARVTLINLEIFVAISNAAWIFGAKAKSVLLSAFDAATHHARTKSKIPSSPSSP
jgi:hypothetical protein